MLLIDDRAGSNELIPLLAGDDTCVCRLDSGDIAIPGNGPAGDIMVGVEIKKVPDLLSSESTGRLAATQVPRLLQDYNEVWLLIIGQFRPGTSGDLQVERNGRWSGYRLGNRDAPYSYLGGFLVELNAMGVSYDKVGTNREAAYWIRTLEHFWSKPWDKHKAMKKFDRSDKPVMVGNPNDPDYRRRLQIAEAAKAFPGMGWDRAWKMADKFTTPYEFITATPAQYAEVDGVGKVLADQLWRAIHGK